MDEEGRGEKKGMNGEMKKKIREWGVMGKKGLYKDVVVFLAFFFVWIGFFSMKERIKQKAKQKERERGKG